MPTFKLQNDDSAVGDNGIVVNVRSSERLSEFGVFVKPVIKSAPGVMPPVIEKVLFDAWQSKMKDHRTT